MKNRHARTLNLRAINDHLFSVNIFSLPKKLKETPAQQKMSGGFFFIFFFLFYCQLCFCIKDVEILHIKGNLNRFTNSIF